MSLLELIEDVFVYDYTEEARLMGSRHDSEREKYYLYRGFIAGFCRAQKIIQDMISDWEMNELQESRRDAANLLHKLLDNLGENRDV